MNMTVHATDRFAQYQIKGRHYNVSELVGGHISSAHRRCKMTYVDSDPKIFQKKLFCYIVGELRLALCNVEHHGKPAVPALTKALTDPEELVRIHAAMGLIRITGKKKGEWLKVLKNATSSKDSQVLAWASGYLVIANAEEMKSHE